MAAAHDRPPVSVILPFHGDAADAAHVAEQLGRLELRAGDELLVVDNNDDPAFRGDASRYNPEELLVASLSACHMLWFLHLCADAGLVVTDYRDEAEGKMAETEDGGGRFTQVTLRPAVRFAAGANTESASRLHEEAHRLCFIAKSVNFPVLCEPSVV